MNDTHNCPICRNADGGSCQEFSPGETHSLGFECEVCGMYIIRPLLLMNEIRGDKRPLAPIQRALLSHRLCMASRAGKSLTITSDWLEYLLENNTLPNPVVQTTNMVRYIGDEVSRSGSAIEQFPVNFHTIIGALNRKSAVRLAKELEERKILTADLTGHPSPEFINISLSLDGWERYEVEKRGQFEGKYGFLAMQFRDSELDPFVKDVVKPTVKEGIGYDLVDMRDVGRAGVIDNIMRTQIRDAAFVIVDLTHDNSGAYWEAGYAEGLGKPVLYICEKTKFDEKKTHFDTNHCLTVPWPRDDDDGFKQELIATLRRSLNL